MYFSKGWKIVSANLVRRLFEEVIKMLQDEKINVSEGSYTNKTSALTKCMLCHCSYLKDAGFKFETHVCIECDDILMAAYELKKFAKLNVKSVDFRCILWGTSKNEAVIRLNSSVLEDKGVL